MQPRTSISRTNSRAAHRLSRPGVLSVALVALVGLALTLVGCSADEGPVDGVDGNTAIVEEWIQAINAEDVAQFENLHTESAAFHSHNERSPANGRQNIWDAFSQSNALPMQEIYMLGQDDMVCLQVTAGDPKRSFLYVLRFEGDLIAQVHEYAADHDLTDVHLFEGAEITTDDAGLAERINVLDSQLTALNERDMSRFVATLGDDPILYGVVGRDPHRGAENIRKDLEDFLRYYPSLQMNTYQAFGQGNLVCRQVAVEGAGTWSIGSLFVFEDGKVAQTYQYMSDAVLSR